jgi:hypothetical protein
LTFKELGERVTLETVLQRQQSKALERLRNKPFGYGIFLAIELLSGMADLKGQINNFKFQQIKNLIKS